MPGADLNATAGERKTRLDDRKIPAPRARGNARVDLVIVGDQHRQNASRRFQRYGPVPGLLSSACASTRGWRDCRNVPADDGSRDRTEALLDLRNGSVHKGPPWSRSS